MYVKCIVDDQVNKTEQFGTEGVSVTFQWPQNYSQNISIIPYLPIDSTGNYNTGIKVNVSYNTTYNVSITPLDPCGQTYIGELYYGKPVIMKVNRASILIF